MEYIDCVIDDVELRVYPCGKIERFLKNSWKNVGYVHESNNYKRYYVVIKYKLYIVSRIIYYAYCREEFDIDDRSQIIDHINKNPLDNRIENLRVVSKQQNAFNTDAKGCHLEKRSNKWRAEINLNNKNKYIGLFATEDEAHQAYLSAKEKYHII